MTKAVVYDSAELLDTAASIEFYMEEAVETGDPRLIVHALGVVARAKSMSDIARKTGLARESLYKALSESGSPEFSTVMRVLDALDLKLVIKRKNARTARRAKKRVTGRKRAVKIAA